MRQRRRNRRWTTTLCIVFALGIAAGALLFALLDKGGDGDKGGFAALWGKAETAEIDENIALHSANAVLVSLESGQTLLARGADARVYPASLTKIMTAVVALENIRDLEETVPLGEDIFEPLWAANAATAGFLPGEEVRAIDLLYGLVLPSGAECGVGLAQHVAGSEEAFVELMNKKAEKLGMDGTHFVNTSGLHNEQHYTTAADMAVLFEYALKDETFYDIATAVRHSTPGTNLHPEGITVESSLLARLGDRGLANGQVLGGKTGYTDEAGQCLASFATIENRRYLLVTCGAYGDKDTQTLHIDDAFAVYGAIRYTES